MAISRTKNVAVNMTVSLATQVVMLFLNFVSRTVFIQTLGIDYLGINGLFHNVLTVLSFAELGIGNAIIFNLYKPLAVNDHERLCSLMSLYKRIYRIIFLVVLIVGLAIIPFLPYLIKGEPNISENLTLIYILYLINTSVSYLYIYKQSIIQADQKRYLVVGILTIASIVRVLAQIAVLYIFHDFILFLVIQIVSTIGGNIVCSYIADKKYPFLKKTPKALEKDDSKKIFKDVKSMAAYKFGSIILNSSDNIIISALVSITTVGMVSNYVMLYGACNTILRSITSAFTASIGNLNATGTESQKYNVFNKVLFITAWMYGMAAVGIIVLSKYFIALWIGEEFILDTIIAVAIVLEFYVAGIHTVESHYRTTMGFFVKGRFAPVLAAVLNIVLSVILCQKIGVVGVFLATAISRVLVLGIVDSWIIFKDGFHRSPLIYFVKNFGYLSLFFIIGLVCSYCISLVPDWGWSGVVIQFILVLLVYNGIMILIFHKTQLFKEILGAIKSLIRK